MVERRWGGHGPPNYPFVLNRASNQARGLLRWWPMLGNQGANILKDKSESGNSGIFPGGTSNPRWISDANRGFVLDFDGNDYVDTGINPLSFPGDFTFTVWFKTTTSYTDPNFADFIGVTDTVGSLMIHQLSFGNEGGGQGVDNGCYMFLGRISTFRVANSSLSGINDGIWHLAVGGRDKDNKVFISADAETIVRSSGTISGAISPDIVPFIGAINQNGVAQAGTFFTGKIADVRIYNRALTPIEVYQLYAPQTRWELYQPLYRLQLVRVATIISLNTLTLASSPQALSVTVDEIVTLNELTLASSVPVLNVAIDEIIALSELVLVSSAEVLTVIPGSVTVALNELTLASSVEALMVLTELTLAMTSLTLTGTSESLAVVSGAVAISLNELTLASSVQTLNISTGQIVTLNELILASDTPNLIFAALIVIVFDFNITRAVTFDMGVG